MLDGGLVLVVTVVPLLFYTRAFNTLLVKDIALGILVCVMGAALLILAFGGREMSWPKARLNAPVWAMIVVSTAAMIPSAYGYASVGAILRLGAGALLYFIVIVRVRSTAQAKRLVWAMAAGALVASIYGVLQSVGKDFVEWGSELTRIPGPYGNPTYFASYLVLLLPLMATMAVLTPAESRAQRPARVLFVIVSALMFACLLWTVAVAAVVGLAVALGIATVALAHFNAPTPEKRKFPKATLIAALAVVAAWALAWGLTPVKYRARMLSLPRPTQHADVRRILIWKAAVQIFWEEPLLGRGPGTYQIHSRGRYAPVVLKGEVQEASGAIHAHNAFLETLAETGILGGAALIWLLGAYFWSAAQATRRALDPLWRNLAIGLAAGVLAYLIQNLFAVTFFVPGCQMFFWLALGLTVAAGQQGENPVPLRTLGLRLHGTARRAATVAVLILLVAFWVTAPRAVAAEYHYRRGEALGDNGLFSEAAEELSKAVALNPYCQRAWYQLGAALGRQGQMREAVQAFERSAALSPDYLRTQYNLGAAYFALKDYSRAAGASSRALQAEKSALNYRALSDAYAHQGKLDLAIERAEQGIREFPKDVPLRQHVARLLLRKGDLARAQRHLERAARLDRNNPETQRLHTVLRALEDQE